VLKLPPNYKGGKTMDKQGNRLKELLLIKGKDKLAQTLIEENDTEAIKFLLELFEKSQNGSPTIRVAKREKISW
jgi:hypothetical protein